MMNTKTEKEIRAIIDAYFKNIPHHFTLNMSGRIADVEIFYTDFKPTRQVRRELEDLIPNLDTCTLYRDYSPEVVCNAIDEVTLQHKNIYIKDEATGEFLPTSIVLLIEEALMNRCLA